MGDTANDYREFMLMLDNLHERLTHILWNLGAKKDISEDDYDLLEFLYKVNSLGELPSVEEKPHRNVNKTKLYEYIRQIGSSKRGGTDIDFLTV